MRSNERLPFHCLRRMLARPCIIAQQAMVETGFGKAGFERRQHQGNQIETRAQIKDQVRRHVVIRRVNVKPEIAHRGELYARP